MSSINSDIEIAIKDILINSGVQVLGAIRPENKIIIERPNRMSYPSISIYTDSGKSVSVTNDYSIVEIIISIYIMTLNLNSYQNTNHSNYDIRDAIIGVLSNKNFNNICTGLNLKGFFKVDSKNWNSEEFAPGTCAWQIDFTTQYEIINIDEDISSILDEIEATYIDEDENTLAVDLIEII